VEEGTKKILGCSIVAPDAGEMIAEITALMQHGLGVEQLVRDMLLLWCSYCCCRCCGRVETVVVVKSDACCYFMFSMMRICACVNFWFAHRVV
jgi:hypothetical protein